MAKAGEYRFEIDAFTRFATVRDRLYAFFITDTRRAWISLMASVVIGGIAGAIEAVRNGNDLDVAVAAGSVSILTMITYAACYITATESSKERRSVRGKKRAREKET